MIKNLKILREKFKISQAALAEAIGVSQQAINKYENTSTEPDIKTLVAIANYFNTSVDYLIGNTNVEHKIEEVFEYHLNAKELSFMDHYRNLTEGEQDILAQTAEVFSDRK